MERWHQAVENWVSSNWAADSWVGEKQEGNSLAEGRGLMEHKLAKADKGVEEADNCWVEEGRVDTW